MNQNKFAFFAARKQNPAALVKNAANSHIFVIPAAHIPADARSDK
jgi:hypothetical protein